jgi:hypothetical protein
MGGGMKCTTLITKLSIDICPLITLVNFDRVTLPLDMLYNQKEHDTVIDKTHYWNHQ